MRSEMLFRTLWMNEFLKKWGTGYWNLFFQEKIKPIPPSRKKKERKRKPTPEEFDPIQSVKEKKEGNYEKLLKDLFGKGEEEEGEEREGRRFISWRIRRGLENNLTDQFVGKIRERVRTSFYLRHNYKTLKMELLSYFIKTQEVPLG